MTVAHKTLTGTDLHESKGVSTATAGQVAIADGAGTAPFGKLTHTSLQTTGNPFGAQLFHVREEQVSGVNSTTSSAAGWVTTVLNTSKTNEITGASLAANQVILPAGTYHFEGSIIGQTTINSSTMTVKARLYNTTTAAVIQYGQAVLLYQATTVGGMAGIAHVRGRFTLAGATSVSLQQQTWSLGGAAAAVGLGTEVYGELMIWKIA